MILWVGREKIAELTRVICAQHSSTLLRVAFGKVSRTSSTMSTPLAKQRNQCALTLNSEAAKSEILGGTVGVEHISLQKYVDDLFGIT